MDLEGATVNGRYDVIRKLQSGYYGTTWLATEKTNGREVCLKTFFAESNSQRKELAVLRELAGGHFAHDNLCSVLDVSLERAPATGLRGELLLTLQYVVFEYCSGSDLFNFLVTGPFERTNRVSSFPEPLARHYFTQALLAVMYLHERGVFHRDIKPENCVLDQHFNLKLTDFGTNKILPTSGDPTQVLRTATKGIGTDSYRAPEVNSHHGYDPSAADVWSLGVTLFFFVGIEVMVDAVQSLDLYMRQQLAPLGILFPFPLHCRLLSSYLKSEEELAHTILSNKDKPLSNKNFWREWSPLQSQFSLPLLQLFDSIFVLVPSLRATLRDLASSAWLSQRPLMPKDIRQQMEARCPQGVRPSLQASPSVVGQRRLGGVDQATLRQSLSKRGEDDVPEYLSDAEVWLMSDALRQLEALQLDIVSSDIQELVMDVGWSRDLLQRILSSPHQQDHRTVLAQNVPSYWVGRLLAVLGFLPQGRLLFLPSDGLDLGLLQCACSVLEGVELAVTRSAVPMTSTNGDDDMTEQSAVEGHVTLHVPVAADSGCSTLHSCTSDEPIPTHTALTPGSLTNTPILQRPPIRKYSSNPELPSYVPMVTDQSEAIPMATTPSWNTSIASSPPFTNMSPLPDSQDSAVWTQFSGTLSAQSSQESCPEAMVGGDWTADYSAVHYLEDLATTICPREPGKFRAAGEFCKLSGLLCSYGLYQVVCHGQLALYCRGNTASFSARVVALNREGKIGLSSWCFTGPEEWQAILHRLSRDMATHT